MAPKKLVAYVCKGSLYSIWIFYTFNLAYIKFYSNGYETEKVPA